MIGCCAVSAVFSWFHCCWYWSGPTTTVWARGLGNARPEPGTTSRALAVHARILEFYDQINLAREIVEPGLKMEAATLWVAGKEKGRIVFGDMAPVLYSV